MLRSLANQPQKTLLLEEMAALRGLGVSMLAILRPTEIEIALGGRRNDGLFEHELEYGQRWLAINELDPQTGHELDTVYFRAADPAIFAVETGRAFALNEQAIGNAASYALGDWLRLHETPLDWLRAGRRGIFVTHWRRAFDCLRYAERLEIPASLVAQYERSMTPSLPAVRVYQRKIGVPV
jgi:hypothetical protein